VVADGIAAPDGTPEQLVSVRLGDGSAAGGNRFVSLHNDDSSAVNIYFCGSGLALGEAVTGVTVLGNTFEQDPDPATGDIGIFAIQSGPPDPSGSTSRGTTSAL